MDYAQLILKIRAKLDISQEELARLVNVSFATVNRWENSKAIPSRRHLCILDELCKNKNLEITIDGNGELK